MDGGGGGIGWMRNYPLEGPFSSEPDLTTAEKELWNSGFPPGVTVDELWHYRRKRGYQPKDHIQLEDGNFNKIKTEYNRRFRNYYIGGSLDDLQYKFKDISPIRAQKPDDNLKVEGLHDIQPENHESLIEYPTEVEHVSSTRQKRNAFQLIEDSEMALYNDNLSLIDPYSTEKNSQFIKYESPDRAIPKRRPTTLKLEGDLLTKTEKAEQFIEYLISQRENLIRNPTTLKMEGDMMQKTETKEQYVPLNYQSRPPLCKKLTNLHLEGDLNILTENNEQFIQHDLEKRPPLTKRSTNLHLEGELEYLPEYRDVYKECTTERRSPSLPQHNLKIDGFFDPLTESRTKFLEHEIHPTIPFLRGGEFNKPFLLGDDKTSKNAEYKDKFVQHSQTVKSSILKPASNLKAGEGDFETITESRRQFIEKPLYKIEKQTTPGSSYFDGIGSHVQNKTSDEDFYTNNKFKSPGRKRRTYSQSTNLKSEGRMDIYPEYKRSFVDFPRQRPILRKPESHLSSEGEVDHITEKRAQFVEYDSEDYQKMNSLKRESEFKLDGQFECQPEYRKAYIDYLIRERVDRKPRPLDNLGTQPKRAFEILTSGDSQSQDSKKNASDSSTTLIPVTDTTSSILTKTTDPLPTIQMPKSLIPVSVKKLTPTESSETDKNLSSSASSTIPRIRRTTLQSARRKSIGKIETDLFGPKIDLLPKQLSSGSSKPTSRSSSPLPPSGRTKTSRYTSPHTKSRYASPTKSRYKSNISREHIHKDRTGSKFDNTVRVNDLAYTPCTSPIPTHKLYSSDLNINSCKKWGKDNRENSSAFFVLEDDVNNNYCDSYKYSRSLPREQKWMPSWHSP